MAELHVRPAASADLADIYAFSLERFGADSANAYHDGLQAAVQQLADYPLSGRIHPGLRPSVRSLNFRKHHIFYDYDGGTVWVVRILHQAVDVQRWI